MKYSRFHSTTSPIEKDVAIVFVGSALPRKVTPMTKTLSLYDPSFEHDACGWVVVIGEPAGVAHRVEAELVERQWLDRAIGAQIARREVRSFDAHLEFVADGDERELFPGNRYADHARARAWQR